MCSRYDQAVRMCCPCGRPELVEVEERIDIGLFEEKGLTNR